MEDFAVELWSLERYFAKGTMSFDVLGNCSYIVNFISVVVIWVSWFVSAWSRVTCVLLECCR